MGKRILLFLLSALMVFSLVGCAKEREKEGEYQVYYLNMEKTKIVSESYDSTGATGEALVKELLDRLASAPESSQLRQTLPSDVTVNSVKFNGAYLYLDFNDAYGSLSKTEELLVRAAIVRTLAQVEGCALISFTINNEPLKTSDGTVVGTMSSDSFVENPGAQINTSVETTINLYFASTDGKSLIKETRTIHHSSNTSMEKLIMEQLIEGPKRSGKMATIPPETKIVNISVVDGVCYVNLSEGFTNQNQEVLEEIVLYSIVNSLTEISNVSKVQLSVNGDTKGNVRYTYSLSKMYERDSEYIK